MGLYDNADDLVVLKTSEQQDRLSMLAQDYLGCFFPVCISDFQWSSLKY